MITFNLEKNLTVNEFRDILVRSTLDERRPVDDSERLLKMLEHGNLLITARDQGKLIGISRALTDFAFCTYLSDLAVDTAYQKRGIGKELIRHTKRAAPDAKLILLSAPAAIHFYPKIGMTQFDFCFYLDKAEHLK